MAEQTDSVRDLAKRLRDIVDFIEGESDADDETMLALMVSTAGDLVDTAFDAVAEQLASSDEYHYRALYNEARDAVSELDAATMAVLRLTESHDDESGAGDESDDE